MAEDLNKQRLDTLLELGRLTQQINRYNEEGIKNAQKENELNRERVRIGRQLQGINSEIQKGQRQAYVDSQNDMKSLASMYDPLKKADMARIQLMLKSGDLTDVAVKRGNDLAEINKKIAGLTSDQTLEREILQDQFDSEITKFARQKNISQEIVDNLKNQNQLARDYSAMTEGQKQQLEAQLEAYNSIKKTIGGILDTASILTRGPVALLGMGLIGAGFAAEKLGKNIRSFGGFVDSAQISALGLSFAFDDAEGTLKELSKEFGGMKDISFQTQLNTNLMATNMGISGAEAANVVGSFARLNEGSAATAMDMAATTKAMGKAAGVPIDSLMKDVAGSTKAFAEYGKNGGINIAKAAVAAAKMGVSMDAMTKVTDSLLDFETSINNEMELGAMMGKQLNLDRARGLAYEGNMTGAVKATLDELGGIEAFNKMDIFQKRKAAELLGLSVDEFQKMAANSDKLNEDGTVQLSTFDTMKETLTAIVTGPMGSFAKTMGSSLIALGQMGPGFKMLDGAMGGVLSKSAEFLKNLVKAGAQKVMGMFGKGGPAESASQFAGGSFSKGKELLAQKKGLGTTPSTAATSAGGGGADQANKFGKIKSGDLIKGAAALLILAAALYVSAKAFQEFATVKWEDVGKGLVGLVGLAGIAYVLSKASGSMIQGAIAIAILGAALIPFAFAMSLIQGLSIDSVLAAAAGLVLFGVAAAGIGLALPFILAGAVGIAALGAALIVFGTGMNLIGSGFGAISATLPAIMEQISAVSQIDYMPIIGLAGALTMLAGALALVAVSGLLALPVLMALGGLSSLFGGGGEGGEGGGKTDSTAQLIEEIKGLRADLNAGKISVHMDGQKVTSRVSAIVDKSSSNSYGKR